MILRAFACLLLFCLPLGAQTLPTPASDTVSDFANVLDATEEGRITRLLLAMREETGVQMVVVTMADIDGYGGTGRRLEDFARDLFNAWGVGGAERNDGILLLVVTEPREARIALGAGYDAVYDGRAARVLGTAVLPAFREGRLTDGIEAGVASARERLVTPFLAGLPVTVNEGFEDAATGSGTLPVAVGGAGFIGAGLYLIWRQRRAKRTCPRCGEPTLTRVNEVIEPPGRFSSGMGLTHLNCTSCGFIDRKSYTIRPRISGSREDPDDRTDRSEGGGSESGGFGGGRSSGGGASGKW